MVVSEADTTSASRAVIKDATAASASTHVLRCAMIVPPGVDGDVMTTIGRAPDRHIRMPSFATVGG
jgi:hypothetical protein